MVGSNSQFRVILEILSHSYHLRVLFHNPKHSMASSMEKDAFVMCYM